MAIMTKSQTFIFIPHLLLLILIFLVPNLNLSRAEIPPYISTTATNTTDHPLDISSLELDAGISEFSTWESASTHRFLDEVHHLGAYDSLHPPPGCKAAMYSTCIFDPSKGVGGRGCKPYTRCPRGVAPPP